MARFGAHIAVMLALAGVAMTGGCELIVGGHHVPGESSSSSSSSSGAGGATGGSGGKTTGTGGTGGATGGTGGATGGTGGATGGTGGATGGTGGTAPTCDTTTCNAPEDCPNPPSECVLRTCDMNCCGTTNEAANKPTTGGQTASDCQVVVCDGAGMAKSINDDADTLDDGNDCTIDACANGTPTNLAATAGTTCSSNGGKVCDGNKACVQCLVDTDCTNGDVCDPVGQTHTCVPATCNDAKKDGAETDVDCGGGTCAPCGDTKVCVQPTDCVSGVCTGGTCTPPACNDAVKNGGETDLDCGGTCNTKCGPGKGCSVNADCVGGSCSGTICLPTCTDGVMNGGETDLDCGGATCAKCDDAKACGVGTDCKSGVCTGGVCQAATCNDTVKNGAETDTDCGGPTCPDCATGKVCVNGGDCVSGVCGTGSPKLCLAPTCTDVVKNGTETDLDCGGAACVMQGKTCAVGKVCAVNADCTSNVCMNGLCVAAACGDGVKSTGEGCDDHNTTSGDGCSSLCFVEFGYTCTGSPSVCTTSCGDGFKAANEGCDDHNTAANDGCSPTCMVEAGYVCTGVAPSVCTASCGDGIKVTTEGCDDGNVGANDGCSPTCTVESGWTCTGTTPTTCAPTCGDAQKKGAETCDDGNTVNGDGCSATCGVEAGYTCTGTGPGSCKPICGDGVKTGTETCDDGNTTNGDGCSSTCAQETGYTCTGVGPGSCTSTCGDGVKASNEACDDGNTNNSDGCSSTCTVDFGYTCTGQGPGSCVTTCGDGKKAASEACDDGNTTNNDGCSSTCAVENGFTCSGTQPTACSAICGDGIRTPTEACDDGNTGNGDGCSSVCVVEPGYTCVGAGPTSCTAGCGDGVKAGAETCDDGNNVNGDGCSAACVVEAGYTCPGQGPGSCNTICGDGIKAGGEACDDLNTMNGDGCSATCTVETGWACIGAPLSVCAAICGDGMKLGAETCDDGNTANGDGCSSLCGQETGWTCTGVGPGSCAAICGDGLKLGAEGCDDGNGTNGDGCSSGCTQEPGYNCIGQGPGSCATSCGDGIKVGAEACDDNNATSGDGCSATCTVEAGFACTGTMPSVCNGICGDSQIKGTEQCDDGNTTNGDGCSSTCQVEPGFELEPNNTTATANDFVARAIGGKINGRITAGDKDYYAFTVPAGSTGTLTAQFVDNYLGTVCLGSAMDTFLSLLDSTGKRLSENDDVSTSPVNRCSKIIAGGLTPGVYYLEARAFSTTGTFFYSLTASMTLVTCGNATAESGETCDDGNTVNNDGCSGVCKTEPRADTETPTNNTCATAEGPYTIPTGARGLVFDGVISAGSTVTSSVADTDFFKFTLTSYSDVSIETFDSTGIGSCQPLVLTNLALFNSACTQIGSTKTTGGINSCAKLSAPTDTIVQHLAPGTYVMRVTTTTSSGSATFGYTVQAKLTAVCGNGVIEGSEVCDGGPTCAADCTLIPVCGNSIKQAGEQCDDGNTVAGDGCSPTCQFEKLAETEGNDTCATANGPFTIIPGAIGTLISANINPVADKDWFRFTTTAYADLVFETWDSTGPGSCSPGTVDTEIQLFASDCTTAFSALQDQGSSLGSSNCSLLGPTTQHMMRRVPPGTYMLYVHDFFGDTSTYGYTLQARYAALCGNGVVEGTEQCDGAPGCTTGCQWSTVGEVEPNDTTAAADTNAANDPLLLVDGNRNITGSLTGTTDKDIYKMVVATNNTVVHLETFDSTGFDCRTTAPFNMASHNLRILNSTGTMLVTDYATSGTPPNGASSTDGTQSGISVCAALSYRLDAGTYYIQVDKTAALAFYQLRVVFHTDRGSEVEPNDTVATGTLASGHDIQIFGDHTVPADTDFYAITVPAGGSIRAEVIEGDTSETCESNGIDSSIALFGPTGSSIMTSTGLDAGRGLCSMFDGTGFSPTNSLAHNLPAGTYYIRVTSGGTTASNLAYQFKYRLVVSIGY